MRVYLKGLVVLLALGFGVAQAQQSVNNILDAGERNIRLAQASQDRVDKIVEQERELVDQYNTVNKEVDGLKVYNALMDRQIQNQVEQMAKLAQSIDQVTIMERQIMPLMLRMIDGLEQFISLDIPFLEEERTNRVEKLRDLMERSDVSVAEKFRNVFEAFSIENEYGRTMSTYKGALTIAGGTREVEFLQIGRIVLLYQTLDGAFTGTWDKEVRKFVELDSSAARTQVRQGLRMARKEIAPELLLLPIDAAEAAQ
ncbi:MAG: DUF3450 domain-containing protein [Proteobacteria bacterium]|nr:DUF3450 domain-containing protein [Pseudomonadota bacterium]